jgi:hypothetical protein
MAPIRIGEVLIVVVVVVVVVLPIEIGVRQVRQVSSLANSNRRVMSSPNLNWCASGASGPWPIQIGQRSCLMRHVLKPHASCEPPIGIGRW